MTNWVRSSPGWPIRYHRSYPKTPDGAAPKREKRIPEYLEADEINAIIRAAPNPKAKLLMLEQWRAGLRVSEALDLEVRDLSLDTATPTLRVRSGKGGKTRLVPVHNANRPCLIRFKSAFETLANILSLLRYLKGDMMQFVPIYFF